jgi:hypothetical protein
LLISSVFYKYRSFFFELKKVLITSVFQYGIEACYILYNHTGDEYYLKHALQVMEKGKALLLQRNAALGNFTEINAIQAKLDSLSQQIAQLLITSKGEDETSAKEAGRKLVELEVEADLLRAQSKEDLAVKAWRQRESAEQLFTHIQQNGLQDPDHVLLHYFFQTRPFLPCACKQMRYFYLKLLPIVV